MYSVYAGEHETREGCGIIKFCLSEGDGGMTDILKHVGIWYLASAGVVKITWNDNLRNQIASGHSSF